jgi:periplasmic divalent cation tolerance protein
MKYILILCTINDLGKAKEILEKLLKDRLIACSNIISQVTSLYHWEGKICEDSEYLMVLKSRSDLFEEIKDTISELHPYTIPEIISVDIKDGSKSYLDWLQSELK